MSRDPSQRPELTQGMEREAEALGLSIVYVSCDPPETKLGEGSGIHFITLTPCVPRAGDYIRLEGGETCEVRCVYFNVLTTRGENREVVSIRLVPNVFAEVVSDQNRPC